MSKRARALLVLTLSLAVVALPACGDDEPPEQRAFTADDDESPDLPENVQTQIRLKYRNGLFTANISATEDYCEEDRTVTIFEDLKKARKDKKVGKTDTTEDGDATLKRRVVGRYYAQVATEPSAEYGELSVCKGKRSQTVIVKR